MSIVKTIPVTTRVLLQFFVLKRTTHSRYLTIYNGLSLLRSSHVLKTLS